MTALRCTTGNCATTMNNFTYRNNMKNILFVCLTVLCAYAFTGCSSDDDSTNGSNNGKGSVSAKVNGTSWSATNVQSTWTSNVLGIGGAQIIGGENQQINIQGMVAATGTYSLNGFSGVIATYTKGSGTAVHAYTAISGTLKVDQLSTSGAKGTFNFQTDAGNSITEGSFDVKF